MSSSSPSSPSMNNKNIDALKFEVGCSEIRRYMSHRKIEKVFKFHNLTNLEAALIELAACAIRGVDKLALPVGSEVLMMGARPTGLILTQLNGTSGVLAANKSINPFSVFKLHSPFLARSGIRYCNAARGSVCAPRGASRGRGSFTSAQISTPPTFDGLTNGDAQSTTPPTTRGASRQASSFHKDRWGTEATIFLDCERVEQVQVVGLRKQQQQGFGVGIALSGSFCEMEGVEDLVALDD
ncbi:hypothetical protein K435DRAFT_866670 [Dendrothele bispora CBS 962.96]|uniref:Uncharacterized protein n=1 Tax=Dendrothele bispora (strain CBS 962.96) TaxID=1314807 RepID=A0A4S8LGY6_DENBC|nr:hypothetical protein K435DRAFT_866670 [Dendrothele bispora CBS 962.96]